MVGEQNLQIGVTSPERLSEPSITARKKSIIGILGNVAELGANRMEETIGEAKLRDAAIGTGIAVDKVLALTGQIPSWQIANIVLPTAEERAERDKAHANLDAITKMLMALHLGLSPSAAFQRCRGFRIAGSASADHFSSTR